MTAAAAEEEEKNGVLMRGGERRGRRKKAVTKWRNDCGGGEDRFSDRQKESHKTWSESPGLTLHRYVNSFVQLIRTVEISF